VTIRFLTKKDVVVESLREQIISGALAPGTRLQQFDIARALGVSPTPVREAFLALHAEGLLEIRPHYGAVVAAPKADDLRDVFRVRGLIEVEALRITSKRVDAKLLAELERWVDQGALALRTLDSASYRRASAKFHETLLAASRSQVFSDLGRQLIARTTFPLERKLMADRLKDHRDLVAALRQRQADRAVTILRRHMDTTPAVLKEILRRTALPEPDVTPKLLRRPAVKHTVPKAKRKPRAGRAS
jgi:DNA-binding GntR family transcriptional regulator